MKTIPTSLLAAGFLLACGSVNVTPPPGLDPGTAPTDHGGDASFQDAAGTDRFDAGESATTDTQTTDDTTRPDTNDPGSPCTGVESCDDGNPCTRDECDPVQGCIHTKVLDGTPCEDGDVCSEGDQCKEGQCVAGTKATCDDQDPCTADDCYSLIGCVHVPFEGLCDDGDDCTLDDRCERGICAGLTPVICDDENPCTDDRCEKGNGCVFVPNSNNCNDQDPCTLVDTCSGGQCLGQGTLSCDDMNPCTDDACLPGFGCVFTPNQAKCDDHNPCTSGDHCEKGYCTGSAQVVCYDDNPCTDDLCSLETGCQFVPNTAYCEDGDLCTVGDRCQDARCQPGSARVCDDQNPCTKDGCDPALGCVFIPITDDKPCEDGNACTAGDVCVDGKCQSGKLISCDDGNPCTTDFCDPSKGCVYEPNTAICDDGNVCTLGDQCSKGSCVPGSLQMVCNDQNDCTSDSCDPSKGCVFKPVTDGKTCEDGNACTTGDSCKAGKCEPGQAVVCDDKNVCTTDTCDPGKGCMYVPNTAACDDGNPCTVGDSCVQGNCKPGQTPLSCDDNEPCTKDKCDPASGCTHSALSDGTGCDDKNPCTTNDSCVKGKCQGVGLNCDDGNPCTDDSCDPIAQKCVYSYNTLPCEDGEPCTEKDQCKNGKCIGAAVTCPSDGNPCTSDECQPGKGCTYPAVKDGTKCEDGNSCTVGEICRSGQCGGGSPVVCNDSNPCTSDSCNPKDGCVYTPIEDGTKCEDQNVCTLTSFCQQGNCEPDTYLNCSDGNVCTDDFCDTKDGCYHKNNTALCAKPSCKSDADTGAWTYYPPSYCVDGRCPTQTGISCDDSNACTDDSCDANKGCLHDNNTDPCDDGGRCTYGDVCSNGQCSGKDYKCDVEPNPHCLGDGTCGCCAMTFFCTTCSAATADRCGSYLPCSICLPQPKCYCGSGDACTLGHTCQKSQCLCGNLGYPCKGGENCCFNPLTGKYFCSEKPC